MHRRRLIKLALLGATVLAGPSRPALSQSTSPGQAPKLDRRDPTAVLLGYVEDASEANSKKFPQYKPGQNCANCQLYVGTGAWAPCTVFQGKLVPAAGWCSAWAKKVPG